MKNKLILVVFVVVLGLILANGAVVPVRDVQKVCDRLP